MITIIGLAAIFLDRTNVFVKVLSWDDYLFECWFFFRKERLVFKIKLKEETGSSTV